jgi:hypothetical protein
MKILINDSCYAEKNDTNHGEPNVGLHEQHENLSSPPSPGQAAVIGPESPYQPLFLSRAPKRPGGKFAPRQAIKLNYGANSAKFRAKVFTGESPLPHTI